MCLMIVSFLSQFVGSKRKTYGIMHSDDWEKYMLTKSSGNFLVCLIFAWPSKMFYFM